MPNVEAIREWVADLRSGRFQQTKRALHDHVGYCCLGVACETYRRVTDSGWEWVNPDGGPYYYAGASEVLPEAVQDWLDLDEDDPEVESGNGLWTSCSVLNDTYSWDFSRIADALEATYLGEPAS